MFMFNHIWSSINENSSVQKKKNSLPIKRPRNGGDRCTWRSERRDSRPPGEENTTPAPTRPSASSSERGSGPRILPSSTSGTPPRCATGVMNPWTSSSASTEKGRENYRKTKIVLVVGRGGWSEKKKNHIVHSDEDVGRTTR